MREHELQGAGPWVFENENDLAPGERFRLDFRNMTYNGRRRWFTQYLPLDEAKVTNEDTGNPVRVEINDTYGGRVPANTIEDFPDAGLTTVEIVNDGGSTIAAGDVIVEVATDGYTADDHAREQRARAARQSTAEQVLRKFVGL